MARTQRKLTDDAVQQMRCLREHGRYHIQQLADWFGCSYSTARDVIEYVNYTDVKDMDNLKCIEKVKEWKIQNK